MIFVGIVEKRGPEVKHKFLKKVYKKGGSVQKRGCTKKGYHQCKLCIYVSSYLSYSKSFFLN